GGSGERHRGGTGLRQDAGHRAGGGDGGRSRRLGTRDGGVTRGGGGLHRGTGASPEGLDAGDLGPGHGLLDDLDLGLRTRDRVGGGSLLGLVELVLLGLLTGDDRRFGAASTRLDDVVLVVLHVLH